MSKTIIVSDETYNKIKKQLLEEKEVYPTKWKVRNTYSPSYVCSGWERYAINDLKSKIGENNYVIIEWERHIKEFHTQTKIEKIELSNEHL